MPTSSTDDYAPANHGQLKNIAKAAVAEMDVKLPGGAGDELHNLVNGWSAPSVQTNDFAPLNIGQLKNVVRPFYDRLIAAGLANVYPWAGSTAPVGDFAIANIGQVKSMFSFQLPTSDVDGNGLPDAWKQQYFGRSGVDPAADADGDGLTNLQEYQNGSDPTDYYNGNLSTLSIYSGGDQSTIPGNFLALPVSVRVNASGSYNAPLTFTVMQGPALLAPDNSGSSTPATTINVRSTSIVADENGNQTYVANVYVYLPATAAAVSTIQATATTASQTVSVSTTAGLLDPATLSPPTNFVATALSSTSVSFSWTASNPAVPTTLQMSVDGGAHWYTIGVVGPGIQSATVTGLDSGMTATFRAYSGGIYPAGGSSTLPAPSLNELPPPLPPSPATSPAAVEFLGSPIIMGEQPAFHDFKKGHGGFLERNTIFLKETIVLTTQAKDNGGNWVFWGDTTTVSTWDPVTGIKTTQQPQVTGNGGLEDGLAGGFVVGSNTLRVINQGNGLNGVKSTYTDTLSDPYTTEMLVSYVESRVPPFQGHFSAGGDWAYLYLDPNGMAYDVYKLQYKWHVNPDLTRAVVWDEVFTPFDANGNWNPGPNDENIIHTIRTWEPGTAKDSPVYTIDPTQLNGKQNGYYEVDQIPAELMVDGNRDGEMSFDNPSVHDQDGTTAEKPYQFWINNDMDADEQDFPPSPADYVLNTLMNRRGLEDFTRLWINLKGLTHMVKTGGVQLELEWKPSGSDDWSSQDHPGIKIFKAVEADGGRRYVEEDAVADQQLALPYRLALVEVGRDTGKITLPLSAETLTALSENAPNLYFIFEGVSAGKGRLVLNLIKNGQKIGEYPPLYLDIRDIKNMYERWTVDPVANVPVEGANPLQIATISTRDLPAGQSAGFTYNVQGPERKTYIVFAHGWNLAPTDKDNFAETSYKRLWWQGYTGRFAAFQWPTTWGFDGIVDVSRPRGFDEGEFIAWRSAPALTDLLGRLNGQCPGQVYLMAHSHGNVVAGEALRLLGRGRKSINTYAACQAAVAAETYDPGTLTTFPLSFPFGTGPTTPDIYPNWLTPNRAGVARKENFFNLNDWALSSPWELDQELKPDSSVFGYSYGWYSGAGNDRFWRSSLLETTYIYLGDQTNPRDRYEIMSFAAEAQSRALGRVSGNLVGFDSSRDMPADDMWGDDPHHNEFRDRAWHSGEFYFSNMQVRNFWDQLLRTYKLKALQ
ncbi:MAG: hypothetical protein ACJ8NS_03270 [Chthoniobacterales bacterium]